MATVYNVCLDGHEVEGMFDENKRLLGAWCLNDADWRHEYMNGFMRKLGINVVHSMDAEMKQTLKEHFGIIEEE